MLLLEVRDLTTNELLTSYDVTEVTDLDGTVRAVGTTMPVGGCMITVERAHPLGDLTVTPAPIAAPVIAPAPDPTPLPAPTATTAVTP